MKDAKRHLQSFTDTTRKTPLKIQTSAPKILGKIYINAIPEKATQALAGK